MGSERVTSLQDHMAFAVMDVLRYGLGLSVPGDVAVAGFDDTPIAAWPANDLTSYREPLDRMVACTVDGLLARIAGPAAPPERIEIEGALIVRGSTAPSASTRQA